MGLAHGIAMKSEPTTLWKSELSEAPGLWEIPALEESRANISQNVLEGPELDMRAAERNTEKARPRIVLDSRQSQACSSKCLWDPACPFRLSRVFLLPRGHAP